MPKILIIEDEKAIRNVLKNILLDEDSSFEVDEAENGEIALEKINEVEYDLIISDIKMPKKDGVEVLTEALEQHPDLTFVMISGHGDIETAVDCIKKGAYDYISKPPDLNRLLNTVRNALNHKSLVKTNTALKSENKALKRKVSKQYTMIGSSERLNEIREIIDKVASTEARVLITGPNGTGKELVAHQLHEKSDRNKKTLIEVNCAAIPAELIESELFGHVKGSFTGAVKDKQGKFELANQGTIFLDEIGDMSLSAQAKVLRALQEGKISPVGSEKEIDVNVRVIAATNKDLRKEIEEGRFREDLYHRLAVIIIEVPALNDRKDDIPELVEHFVVLLSENQGLPYKKFDASAYEALKEIDWTGNIRELRNVVERLLILSNDPVKREDVEAFVRK
ncbi:MULTISPECIES: sigma-54-dependent transcriptional regulator [Weeksella]|uniref:Two component, sigma54 specific, transcriptional regulator n=1 Tax=Weeksella virosa (strain ATCC 43766 / DSM 16922 / JCM 21250 / CCUG 30538 / CDC 9751 / IAM 14551 / NBRC 16016 / NCTC 11634 / CL345/78) TaxID=865938 RepID=F0NZJ0_WEEVC|nr:MULTISPECIES: sigma-54 dependent transcriptional regulator [Weeksella]ADX68337.1 putative two component, sigma54 specific, transcriptional regulator [Weeksella virosa DSM 16922]MDK7374555.1 sigma-54 dependent transcriptional regulator [Weeksella virosa]MDK7674705.1 sigma-54 dependent transcriptional regulator [Weeksella virosa]OFM83124.1 Fis family transcriptional regulator [Weeksella sp. HMSC059D05]SUP54657.1 Transcriptional regulatory protein ZraR [Weeksella virosa]